MLIPAKLKTTAFSLRGDLARRPAAGEPLGRISAGSAKFRAAANVANVETETA
ncbi:hypothetical protein SPHINGOT1_270038 [Sphingomonas sp. T1]|nr:hypothetical protein SPHINGOT1_270038 [Sphingomonas sp. T1]